MDPLQKSSGEVQKGSRPSTLRAQKDASASVCGLQIDEETFELLHELNNVFVSMLLNAQVMEWKLPSYSRLKRNLHEVERNAQRGGELVKRLMRRLGRDKHCAVVSGQHEVGELNPDEFAVAGQEPNQATAEARVEAPAYAAPAHRSASQKVPHTPM